MRALPATTAILVTALSGCAGVTTVPRAATMRAPRAAARTSYVAARTPAPPARSPASPPFAIGERTITFVDTSRTVRFPGRPPQPRTLVTVIRYPAQGPRSGVDLRNASPVRTAGRFPLMIFGHGFAVTPGIYARCSRRGRPPVMSSRLRFPAGNANAPGGPDEQDIEPAGRHEVRDHSDARARATAHRSSQGLIDPHEIAVSGQSDGGETALAVAYDPRYRDPRVRAAVILSGAEIPFSRRSRSAPVGRRCSRPRERPTRSTYRARQRFLRHRPAAEVPALAARRKPPSALHRRAATALRRRASDHGLLEQVSEERQAGSEADDCCRQRARRGHNPGRAVT